ncbi:MAG: PilZ domain-containing protein [Acetobacteraceae bacterium]|nr:PilZ domain-containing protein [Acetobacteraceae bacterium]
MDRMVIEEPAAEEEPADAFCDAAPSDKRREGRKAFLKRAQVVFEGAGIDCIVENMSSGGARVRFGSPVALPDVLALRFHDGTSHPVRRRWGRGEVAGLEFSGEGPAAEAERRHLAQAVQDAVAAADPTEAVRLLRQVWFFGDESLRRAAESLEIARARFVAALNPHLEGRAPPPTVSVRDA